MTNNTIFDASGVSYYINVPSGTKDERSEIPIVGQLRWNTDTELLEYYIGTEEELPTQEDYDNSWRSVLVESDYNYYSKAGLLLYLDVNDPLYVPNGEGWPNSSKYFNLLATLVNGFAYDSANKGSIIFNGTSNYAQVSKELASLYLPSGNGFTFCFWFKSDSTNNYGSAQDQKQLFSIQDASFNDLINIGVNPSGNGIYYNDSSVTGSSIGSVSYNDNNWHYLCVARDYGSTGQNVNIYIDGQNIGNIANSNPNLSLAEYVTIGGKFDGTNYINLFAGNMGMFISYERSHGATEVLNNYNSLSYRYI